jgi:hypothetical protein
MEPTQIHHEHECPTDGCHKTRHCTNPECARHYYKHCDEHTPGQDAPKAQSKKR